MNEIEQWESEKVLSVLQYELFTKELDEAFFELNKESK